MTRETFSYTHGDSGSKPSSSLDFAANLRPNPQDFDWWWSTVIDKIEGHAAEFDRLDSDDDGVVDDSDKLGGDLPSAFLSTSGDTMSGDLDLGDNELTSVRKVKGDNGTFDFTSNHNVFSSNVSGADIRFFDTNSNDILRVVEDTNDVLVPNGELSEQGDRVATRTWTENNADVPNADYADDAGDADTVDGQHADSFVDEAGDTMTGDLSLGANELITNNGIRGTDDTQRLSTDLSTILYDDAGSSSFMASDGEVRMIFASNAEPFRVRDEQSHSTGIEYTTGDSLGTLDTPNATIEEQGNRVATRTWTGDNYVSESGDTMSGNLGFQSGKEIQDSSGNRSFIPEYRNIYADSNNDVKIYDDVNSQDIAEFKPGGDVFISNGNLNVNSNVDAYALKANYLESTKGNFKLWLEGNSGDKFTVADTLNGTDIAVFNEGGLVDIQSGNLRLATGQSIEDGSGNPRVTINSDRTEIRPEDGGLWPYLALSGGNHIRIGASGTEPFQIYDEQGSFIGVQYTSSSSAPGELALPNAELHMQDNSVKTNNFEVTENSSTNSLDFNYTGS